MAILNIPLGSNYSNSLRDHILNNFKHLHPNFSNISVITPSKNTAEILKLSFASCNVIMPKITSISELTDNLKESVISNLEAKILLFNVAKKHLPNFQENEILYFIDDFLELETLIAHNQTDLTTEITKMQGVIEDMVLKIKQSLISFLKIFQEWQKIKLENNIQTQVDLSILTMQDLCNNKFAECNAVFLAYFQGLNKYQAQFVNHINSLPNGFVVFNFEAKKGIISMATQLTHKIINFLNQEVVNLSTNITKPKCFIQKFPNILTLTNQLVFKVISLLQSNSNLKIGIICYNANTGKLITEVFKDLNIPTTTIFTSSIKENIFFLLFVNYLNSDDIFCYLSLIKSSLTIFNKEEVEKFEKELKKPNLKINNSFNIPKLKLEMFDKFLINELEKFKSILTPESFQNNEFEIFENFILTATKEVKNFTTESILLYQSLLKNIAQQSRQQLKEGNNIYILSAIEARGMNFDYLFLTDLTEDYLPSSNSSNKILNYHLQTLIKINENKQEIEWNDFTTLLNSSQNIYAFFSSLEFEGKKGYSQSPFLLHAMEYLDFKTCNEKFYTDKSHKTEDLSPNFEANLITYFSPTSFECLMNNPLLFYIKYILKLKEMSFLPNTLEKTTIGTIIHNAIYSFYQNQTNIKEFCKEEFYKINYEHTFFLYEESLQNIQNDFLNNQSKSANPLNAINESEISCTIQVNNQNIFLTGRPDRVEFYEDCIKIIDYKVTSSVISLNAVQNGKKPQLPFLGFIISQLYPDFKDKIELYYYYINISNPTAEIKRKQINFTNFNLIPNTIQDLLLNLKTFINTQEVKFNEKFFIR
jgi:hypothetical protein